MHISPPQVLILSLVVGGLGSQHSMDALKWISAFGVCLAYLVNQ